MSDVIRYTIIKRTNNAVETKNVDKLTPELVEKHKRDIILDNISGNAKVGAEYFKTLVDEEYETYLKETGLSSLKSEPLTKILFHYEKRHPTSFNNHAPVNTAATMDLIYHAIRALKQK